MTSSALFFWSLGAGGTSENLDVLNTAVTFASFDEQFQQYLEDVLVQYGWPRGPINAVELWNEPREGVEISGWGADGLRFHETCQHMAKAVLDARKKAGVQVLMGGACSSSNTRDKPFCDGTDTFLPLLDFVSIHYQPLAYELAVGRSVSKDNRSTFDNDRSTPWANEVEFGAE